MNGPGKEFLNEPKEWHAFWLGVVRGVLILNIDRLSDELRKDIKEEYHYHMLGLCASRILVTIFIFTLGAVLF